MSCKNREPDEQEKEIIRRNGIECEHVSVTLRTDTSIHLLNHKTRDDIVIYQGDRKW